MVGWLVEREREQTAAGNCEDNFRESNRGCTQVLNYLTKDVKHEETKTESAVKC